MNMSTSTPPFGRIWGLPRESKKAFRRVLASMRGRGGGPKISIIPESVMQQMRKDLCVNKKAESVFPSALLKKNDKKMIKFSNLCVEASFSYEDDQTRGEPLPSSHRQVAHFHYHQGRAGNPCRVRQECSRMTTCQWRCRRKVLWRKAK